MPHRLVKSLQGKAGEKARRVEKEFRKKKRRTAQSKPEKGKKRPSRKRTAPPKRTVQKLVIGWGAPRHLGKEETNRELRLD